MKTLRQNGGKELPGRPATGRSHFLSRYCYILFLLAPVGSPEAQEPGAGETDVRVLRGSATLHNSHGSLPVAAGEKARMTPSQPPCHAKGETLAPGCPPPLDVQWWPGARTVLAEEQTIQLEPRAAGGAAGQTADGKLRARLEPDGALVVEESAGGREARRTPDGVWTHRLAGLSLRISPDGAAAVQFADGRSLRLMSALPERAAGEAAPSWKIGVHLDRQAAGRLVVGRVEADSPAERAGFQPGDEILRLGDRQDPTLDQVVSEVRRARRGEKIHFAVRRQGQVRTLEVIAGQ